jgi:hypothetical protein
MKSFPKNVAAGILPAVEGGILPPGSALDFPGASECSTLRPPGWKPRSTAGADACRSGKLRIMLVAAAALAALEPSPLFACAACYGRSDSPLANGMNWGIFTLLGVVLTVLTCVALFFVHIARGEQAQIESENNSTPPPQNPTKV